MREKCMAIFQDNSQSVGNTPLVRLNRVVGSSALVYGKVEGRNPSFSVKCRLGLALILDAEEKGLLKPGGLLVEPSSGNTGIALAATAAARGYRVVITMPETMSLERRQVMTMLGARIVLTPAAEGMAGAIKRAQQIAAQEFGAHIPDQFNNPANPAIHEKTTGPEIWADTQGRIEVLVAGVGTGGTISGAGAYLKSKRPDLKVIAVEPASSPVLTQHFAGDTIQPGRHLIEGIGAGFIPKNLNLEVVDKVVAVTNEEAIDFTRRLAREEGLLVGISSGAAVAAAARLADQPEFFKKTMVVVLPDAGERYLSSALYSNLEFD